MDRSEAYCRYKESSVVRKARSVPPTFIGNAVHIMRIATGAICTPDGEGKNPAAEQRWQAARRHQKTDGESVRNSVLKSADLKTAANNLAAALDADILFSAALLSGIAPSI